jgi:hypothetical protein
VKIFEVKVKRKQRIEQRRPFFVLFGSVLKRLDSSFLLYLTGLNVKKPNRYSDSLRTGEVLIYH